MKRIYSKDYGGGRLTASADPQKDAIMTLLVSVSPVAVAAGYFTDAITGKQVVNVDDMGYMSGPFSWSTGDVHHFEKYDLELSQEFRDYALAR